MFLVRRLLSFGQKGGHMQMCRVPLAVGRELVGLMSTQLDKLRCARPTGLHVPRSLATRPAREATSAVLSTGA